jgi:flagellar biosynthesis GTPase FlhF
MIHSVASPLHNPTLGFRLDPGDPGLLRQAPASESTLRVFQQELRNLVRLKGEAAMRGERVIYADLDLYFSRNGSYVSANSGHTTVVSVGEARTVRPSEDVRDQEPSESKESEAAGQTAAAEEARQEEQIEETQTALERKKAELEQKIDEKRTAQEDPVEVRLRPESEAELRQKLEEVDQALRQLEVQRLQKMAERMNALLGAAAESSSGAVADLLRARPGASPTSAPSPAPPTTLPPGVGMALDLLA